MTQTHEGPVETFIEEDDDWLDSLEGPFRSHFLDAIRELPIRAMLRLPPPKRGRIPFGHELRVARRFLSGQSMQFEPSALWRLYQSSASKREVEICELLVRGKSTSRTHWENLLGTETIESWLHEGLFREAESSMLRSRFSIYSVEGVILIGDPQDSRLLRRVLIGQDSFRMGELMVQEDIGRRRRYLDVGPGSGVVLLVGSRYADECLGLDINPRAVKISTLNADLNNISHCEIRYDDAIKNGPEYGRFDLITWNTPFVFLPPECKDTHFDAYGGDLGIQILLDFLEVLPELMDEEDNALAYVAACGPIFADGANPLEERLQELGRRKSLEIEEHITQSNWHEEYRYFQEEHGIRRFEHSFLTIRRGAGGLQRFEAKLGVRLADLARERAYQIWK